MKTKIKVLINGNSFEVESSYEHGYESIIKMIDNITKQQITLEEKK